jgi:hypothetical protein
LRSFGHGLILGAQGAAQQAAAAAERPAYRQSAAGRYLGVVYVPEPGGVFVITAYDLGGKPLKAYKRRMKRRKR